jgi:hypothetical protein
MVLLYFTTSDDIVKGALLSVFKGQPEDKMKNPVIVGGVAIQLHCQDIHEALRSTSDMDLMYIPQIQNFQAFSNGIGKSIQSNLIEQGYQVQLKKIKDRPNYEVKIMNGQGNKAKELFFIHFDMPSPKSSAKTLYITEREVEHAIALDIGSANYPILVKRIEDILPHKLKRVNKIISTLDTVSSLEKVLFNLADQGNWKDVANAPMGQWLNYILEKQNQLDVNQRQLPKSYTLNKDLYDICLLARKIEGTPGIFNKAYYEQAKQEVNSI